MSESADRKDERQSERKNLFLSAVIDTPFGRRPARIRNMCASGAMIEARDIPEEGSFVSLRRGSLHVRGCVAWRNHDRGGLALSSAIDVDAWLAPPANSRQAEVDAIFHRPLSASDRTETVADEPQDRDVAEALSVLGDLLRAVGDRFARDPVILANRTLELQAFDVAAQVLEALAGGTNGASSRVPNAVGACRHLFLAMERGP